MRLTLSKKIIGTIQLSVLSGIFLFGIFTLFFIRNNIEKQINIQLESISSLKTANIKQYLDFHILEVESSIKSNHIKAELVNLLEGKSKDNGSIVIKMLLDGMIYSSDLLNIYIIDNDGVVLSSNTKTEEGKIRSNESYFRNGKEKTTVQSFHHDISSKEIITIISTPIKDDKNKTIGVFAVEINIVDINKLMSNRAGLGETGETFLVNSLNFVTTDLLKEKDAALKKTIYLPQIDKCLNGNSNFWNTEDYHGDKVYGYARYLPEINSCLVSKVDSNELLKPIKEIIPELILFILIICFATLILGYLIGESIIRPLRILRDKALKVKDGDLDIQIERESNDEVGDMAISFKEMLAKLKELYKNLESKVKERTDKLEESEKKLQKNLDLYEKINKIMVGRELEMIKLKKELENLKNNK